MVSHYSTYNEDLEINRGVGEILKLALFYRNAALNSSQIGVVSLSMQTTTGKDVTYGTSGFVSPLASQTGERKRRSLSFLKMDWRWRNKRRPRPSGLR